MTRGQYIEAVKRELRKIPSEKRKLFTLALEKITRILSKKVPVEIMFYPSPHLAKFKGVIGWYVVPEMDDDSRASEKNLIDFFGLLRFFIVEEDFSIIPIITLDPKDLVLK